MGRLVDEPVLLVALERPERADPVAGRAAQLQHCLPGPGQRRRAPGCFLRISQRRGGVVAALRLDEQPAQPEDLGVGSPRHGAERFLRRRAVAVKLRGLRRQQQRERLVGREAVDLAGELARSAHVARSDRNKPSGNGGVAAGAAPLAEGQREKVGRAQQRAEQRPQHDRHHRHRDHGAGQHDHRSVDPPA